MSAHALVPLGQRRTLGTFQRLSRFGLVKLMQQHVDMREKQRGNDDQRCCGDIEKVAHGSIAHVQIRPNAGPGLLAQLLPTKNAARLRFQAHRLCGVHIAPPSQALIEVLGVDAVRLREAAPQFGADFCRHGPHRSESLDACQAIRYGLCEAGLLKPKIMETSADRRKRKLAKLASEAGGIRAIADKSGVSWASLDQILKGALLPPKLDGSRSPRSLGNTAARAIERAFDLGDGWFDAPDQAKESLAFGDLSAYEAVLISVIRDGLTPEELIQLTEAVNGAIKTKRIRESTGDGVGEIGVYFAHDRRTKTLPVSDDRREALPWERTRPKLGPLKNNNGGSST